MIQTLIDIIFLITGYYLGRQLYYRDEKNLNKVGRNIKRIIHTVKPSGAAIIHRPTVDRLKQLQRAKIKTDETKALEETFTEIPELKKAKELNKKYGNNDSN